MTLKISIIIPAYNAQSYIEQCVLSAINQTYKNIEVIIVDDGSTDNTLKIIEGLARNHENILVISQKNQGVTAARRAAVLQSTGDYITFLDADDILCSEGIEILFEGCQKGKFDIVNGSFLGKPSNRLWLHKDIGTLNKDEYLESIILGNTYSGICASIYRSTLFIENTLEFDSELKIGEDILMNIELASRVDKVKNISDIVYYYTDDNTSSAMTSKVRHPYYHIKFYKVLNQLYLGINPQQFSKNSDYLLNQQSKTIMESFFQPAIECELEVYKTLVEIKKNYEGINIYSLALSSYQLTRLLKISRSILSNLKRSFKRMPKIKKQVIY
jgi:glycosyltransferase involved in cell wall biosynthesis